MVDQQSVPYPAESLKKTPDERRTEKMPGREKIPFGLRPSFLLASMEQHPGPDSKRKIVMS